MESDGLERDAVVVADRVGRAHPLDEFRGRGAVAVARTRARPRGEDPGSERGRVEGAHTPATRLGEQWLGGAIDEREPVVAQHHVEQPGLDILEHERDRARCDTDRVNGAALAEFAQALDGAATACGLSEGHGVGVVEVEHLDALDPQAGEALVVRAQHALAIERAGVEIAIDLRHDSRPRCAAELCERRAQHFFRAPAGVLIRGVDKAEGSREHGARGRDARGLLG